MQAINFEDVTKRSHADKQLSNFVDNLGVRQFLLRNLALNNHGEFHLKCNLDYISKGYQQIMLANKLPEDKEAYQGNVLFIKGSNSDYILTEHKTAITIFFPHSKAKVIQGAGHWLHAEKTIAFNKIALNFLML